MAVPKSRVLLVEDSKFLRLANERALAKAGYEVSTASDGEEALHVANDKLPDIILLDMMLPKISGQDVLKALKSSPATEGIPVIVLTSLSQKNEEKLLHEGAAAYFEKSALELDKSSDLLADAVDTVLRRVNHQKHLDLLLREAALKRSIADDSSADDSSSEIWELETSVIDPAPRPVLAPTEPFKH